ncbi:hypothetical protein [Mangrovimonas sp. YM274]|uniref:hypothetical protein n=1 Tax=Mangrovimonas sp. YM274 TaxID=3070660 RepID=UPI0027DAF872|nr:hypothetical protein [Mangrovimonas sp. YM274]WMI69492.1 hypothetical protein RBH95_03780 [Mangrovimonas sp. YM274]
MSFTACKETKEKTEEVTETVETTVEDAVDAVEDAADATGEAMEDAANATEEAVEEAIDEAVEGTPVDVESVTVEYDYMVAGKEVKGSKTFSGSQEEVEAAVKALQDSLTKVDPNIKVSVKE